VTARTRTRPRRLHQDPEAVTWARQKAGLTKRALAAAVGISEQLMGEIKSGWRSATPANLARIADALNCPLVALERRHEHRGYAPGPSATDPACAPRPSLHRRRPPTMTITDELAPATTEMPRMRSLALDLTRACQAACDHCYNHSGPGKTTGA
jgi:transcriptional regulator with XRE-family HTH domain